MRERVCPECDKICDDEFCPTCEVRTLILSTREEVDPLLGVLLDGRYRVESLLGRGGMGAVYKAEHVAMRKTVAVKVVRSDLSANLEAAKRFHREARAASMLSHPHTIRVFDFGQAPDLTLYMVMEFLDGRSLGQLVFAEGSLAPERAVRIAGEIARSLIEAHGAGLAHRDLKPENVMLLDAAGHPDFVKVLDFGIAKFLSGSSGISAVTRTGAVVGTPHYMAPEQASAPSGLTSAVDIYALGVILFEMLSGELPFQGQTPVEVLMAHASRPVPELPADTRVPESLAALLAQMLAKEPGERPVAEELVTMFDAIGEELRGGTAAVVRPTGAGQAGVAPKPSTLDWSRGQRPGSESGSAVSGEGRDSAPDWERPASSRRFWILGAMALLTALGLGSLRFLVTEEAREGEHGASEATPGPTAASSAAEPLRPAAEAKVEAPPPTFVAHFASTPAGANVSYEGVVIGTTPFSFTFPGPARVAALSFRLDGYRRRIVEQRLAEGAEIKVVLQADPAKVEPETPAERSVDTASPPAAKLAPKVTPTVTPTARVSPKARAKPRVAAPRPVEPKKKTATPRPAVAPPSPAPAPAVVTPKPAPARPEMLDL